MRIASALSALLCCAAALPAAEAPPRSLDPRLTIELFAEQPQVRTPTGIDVDARGRVWVIESNTHFRPDDYDGHPSDRLLILIDADGDGRADEVQTFADGFQFAMSVAVRPVWMAPVSLESRAERQDQRGGVDDPAKLLTRDPPLSVSPTQVFLAERSGIWLLEDTDGDDVCDRRTKLVTLETEGNYPHNGLAGFAFDALGWMYFGLGENLGAPYRLVARESPERMDKSPERRDKSPEQGDSDLGAQNSGLSTLDSQLSGGGEGGNLYRMRPDGTQLTRWATGFWNPHASCVDAFGRVFTVDNDPDSRPPCRLLHIIEGGDYGYRFRNGRKGLHPFTSWNGEIPGTLPMVAGTGEAPSGILAYEHDAFPEEYLGNLFVTSWGDHRIDRFRLKVQRDPKHPRIIGPTFESIAEPVITGGENFRPVGIALAPDGSLYVSDWVLRDYKLHGMGRVWRVRSLGETAEHSVLTFEDLNARTIDQCSDLLLSAVLPVRRLAAKHLSWRFSRSEAERDAVLKVFETRLKADFSSPSESRAYYELLPSMFRPWPREIPFPVEWDDAGKAAWIVNVNKLHRSDHPFNNAAIIHSLSSQEIPEWLLQYWYTLPNDVEADREWTQLTAALVARRRFPKSIEFVSVLIGERRPVLRRLAVQWVAEEKLTDLRPQVEAVLKSEPMTTDLFLATLAALEMLDGKDPKDFDQTPPGKYVLPLLKDEAASAEVIVQALRLVDPADEGLTVDLLRPLLADTDASVRLEAVRSLAMSANPAAVGPLVDIVRRRIGRTNAAASPRELQPVQEREELEALAGLARHVDDPVAREALLNLLGEPLPFRVEVFRALRALAAQDADVRHRLRAIVAEQTGRDETSTEISAQLALLTPAGEATSPEAPPRPLSDDDWRRELLELPSEPRPSEPRPSEPRPSGSDQAERASPRQDPAPSSQTPATRPPPGAAATLPDGRGSDSANHLPPSSATHAGERVFFHPNGPRCYQCHTVHGRGGRIGPDLSYIGRAMSREKLLDSILNPSKEVSPQFTTWNLITTAGEVHTGMIVHENKGETTIGTAEGKLIIVPTIEIETRTPLQTSVMPEKLEDRLTVQEFRDLLRFLETLR